MPLILDRQHQGKGGRRRNDTGCARDLDGDGTISRDEEEAYLTEGYIQAATLAMCEPGRYCPSPVLTLGSYAERHRIAVELATGAPLLPFAYVACHVNAGGGDFGLVLHDHRSKAGKRLALAIAAELTAACPELREVQVRACSPDDWTANAYSTIKGIYQGPSNIAGVCFEPGFIDCARHAPLWTPEGLARIGGALGDGAYRYLYPSD